jgi:FkbM family methyltransferase
MPTQREAAAASIAQSQAGQVQAPPLAAPFRVIMRTALRTWARTGRKSGRHFQIVQKWGARLATKPLLSRLPNGCLISCDLTEHIQRQIYFLGVFEPVEAFLFTRLLKPGCVVADVGANIGQYTLLATTVAGPTGAVHSFEPIPSTYAALVANIQRNSLTNVSANRAALWHEHGTVSLGRPQGIIGNLGSFSVGFSDLLGGAVEAPALTLDEYAERNGVERFDLIKMDIQGAEPFALRGARRLLEQSRPLLLMEVDRRFLALTGSSPEAVWDDLKALGYRAWRIGLSLKTSGSRANLDGVESDNFLFHTTDLPAAITTGWERRTPKRWASSGWLFSD